MPRIEPLAPGDRADLGDFEGFFKIVEQTMGFVPNSLYTMGRKPALLQAFAALTGAVLGPGRLSPELKQLVAFVSSNASGCRYCQAHTSHSAHKAGASADKIAAAFEFDSSPLFDARERAALSLANAASLVPNATTDAHFAALRPHFDEEEVVELLSVISLFGWLNRWNDTVGTELEATPLAFADSHLKARGWDVGRHGSDA